jgi:hypothetical protein
MSYTWERLQFGSNNLKVPCHGTDPIFSNEPSAPIEKKLVDCDNPAGIWDLVFSFESGGLYLPNDALPGNNGATIESWYVKEGGNGGHHSLSFLPFVMDQNGAGGFGQATHYVDFSGPTTSDSSIDTDTIPDAKVTATVHSDLPEYSKFSISTHATNQSIIIQTTTTQAQFEKIFVYYGSSVPIGNMLTVAKGQSCAALAVFKKTTTSGSVEIGTIQYPTISKQEWPILVSEIVQQVLTKGSGEIYEFLSPRLIASLGPEAAKTAVADISRRIEKLGQIKSVVSGLAGQAREQAAGR